MTTFWICLPAKPKIRNRVEAFLLEVVNSAAHHARHGLPPRWHELLRDIDDRLAHPPTIAEMSKRMAMSVSRFKIVFKRRTGDPPGDYIRRRRIDLAKRRLLEDKDKSIACLSGELSFSTPQYFTAVFNRYTGVTPTAFRKRKR
jgi:AraC-like DNA-binding protein